MLGEKRCEAKGRVSIEDTLEHKEVHIRAVKLFKYAVQHSEVHEIKLLHNKITFLLSCVCIFGLFCFFV